MGWGGHQKHKKLSWVCFPLQRKIAIDKNFISESVWVMQLGTGEESMNENRATSGFEDRGPSKKEQ